WLRRLSRPEKRSLKKHTLGSRNGATTARTTPSLNNVETNGHNQIQVNGRNGVANGQGEERGNTHSDLSVFV
ncbi:unnamed protein product, partial [Musa acuminata subsp. burmannicoides]